MTDENDTKQNVPAKLEKAVSTIREQMDETLRWDIIQLIYDTNKKEDIFEYADQIYQYVMNGKTNSA